MAALRERSGDSDEIRKVLASIDDIVPKLSDSSIAKQLFDALNYGGFKTLLQKCQRKVILVKSGTSSDEAKLCVSDVKVTSSKDGLTILTEPDVDEFLSTARGLPRAFLVSSESDSMVEAKLAVYRKFKYHIDDNGIRIHHDLDGSHDFLNHCGHFAIDSFQMTIEKLKESVPVDEVERIVREAADQVFSWGNIRDTCKEVYLTDRGENIGTVRSRSYDCRSHFTVKRIKGTLVSETLREIGKTFCNKVFRDIFELIRSRLESNINADLHSIKFSISEETFMKYSAHIAVMTVVVGLLFPILGFMMAAFAIVFTFFWSVDINSNEWRVNVANELHNQVTEKKDSIVKDVVAKMKNICKNTIKELCSTVEKLDKAKKEVVPLNQEQIAREWELLDSRNKGMVSID